MLNTQRSFTSVGWLGETEFSLPYYLFEGTYLPSLGSSGSLDGKKSTCNEGDPDLIPGSGRSPGEGNGTHYCILAWRIPWTEELGRLYSMGRVQRAGHD